MGELEWIHAGLSVRIIQYSVSCVLHGNYVYLPIRTIQYSVSHVLHGNYVYLPVRTIQYYSR